jgi:uncharacterized repeat protein (TIGR03803 family)
MNKFNWLMKACGVLMLWGTVAVALPAQTFTTLHSFDVTDGANPYSGLVQATDGNFYGTTANGGANNFGTVFKIASSGNLTTLHSFDETDGAYPYSGLVQGTNGDLYGTTYSAGAHDHGTVFKITPSGTLTTLYNFCSQSKCSDGACPYAGLLQGADGNFYGTTGLGGTAELGTVFKITPSGTLTILHSFDGTDGYYADGPLVQSTGGNFYGTTEFGGIYSSGNAFKITPSGTLTTLYNFCSQSNCPDGARANGLVQGTDGNFYGTTQYRGANDQGTVFKITPSGTLTTLYNFCSQSKCSDGAFPLAPLVQTTDGNFFGTTSSGGNNAHGTVFTITLSGTLTTLYNFCSLSNCSDGSFH